MENKMTQEQIDALKEIANKFGDKRMLKRIEKEEKKVQS